MLTSTLHLTHKARRMARDSQAIHRTIAHVLDGRGLWGTPDPGVLVTLPHCGSLVAIVRGRGGGINGIQPYHDC